MAFKVLLVDDDQNIAECLECILGCSGLDVEFTHVSDGQACLDELRKGFEGCILMDVMMPGLNGWQTLEMIVDQNLCDNAMISMFTSVADPPPESDRLASYVFNYVRKPTSTTRILEVVNEAISMLRPAC